RVPAQSKVTTDGFTWGRLPPCGGIASLEFGVWSSRVWSLVFGVWSLEFRSLEFGVWGLEFGVWSLEFGVWSLEFGVWSLDCFSTQRPGGPENWLPSRADAVWDHHD